MNAKAKTKMKERKKEKTRPYGSFLKSKSQHMLKITFLCQSRRDISLANLLQFIKYKG
jgi:hypothetical protein